MLSFVFRPVPKVKGEFELNAVDLDAHIPKAMRGLREMKAWTVDSGASQSVADPKDLPGAMLEPSPGSIAGQKYVGPGGELIPNEGQLNTIAKLENQALAKVKFQAAKVRRPLLAVSSLVDKDNLTLFDKESFVIPAHCPEVAEIRRLVANISTNIPLHRDKGVYTMRAWESNESVFPRPGR